MASQLASAMLWQRSANVINKSRPSQLARHAEHSLPHQLCLHTTVSHDSINQLGCGFAACKHSLLRNHESTITVYVWQCFVAMLGVLITVLLSMGVTHYECNHYTIMHCFIATKVIVTFAKYFRPRNQYLHCKN